LLFPQPFGPTMAVTPRSKERCIRSENDLKPEISSCCSFIILYKQMPRAGRRRPACAEHHRPTSGWDALPDETLVRCANATEIRSERPRPLERAPLDPATVARVTSRIGRGKNNTERY